MYFINFSNFNALTKLLYNQVKLRIRDILVKPEGRKNNFKTLLSLNTMTF